MAPSLAKLTHFAIFAILTMVISPSIGALTSTTTLAKPISTHTTCRNNLRKHRTIPKFTESCDFTACEIITKLATVSVHRTDPLILRL